MLSHSLVILSIKFWPSSKTAKHLSHCPLYKSPKKQYATCGWLLLGTLHSDPRYCDSCTRTHNPVIKPTVLEPQTLYRVKGIGSAAKAHFGLNNPRTEETEKSPSDTVNFVSFYLQYHLRYHLTAALARAAFHVVRAYVKTSITRCEKDSTRAKLWHPVQNALQR